MIGTYRVIKVTQEKEMNYDVTFQSPLSQIVTLSLHEELVLTYRLVVGKELTTKQMQELNDQLDYGKVYQAALKILARQSYTRADLKQKLVAKNFEDSLIQLTVDKLEEIGMVNDNQFVISYIQHHSLMGKKGPAIIKKELIRKGISDELINQHLSNYKEEDQLEHVSKLMAQQLRLNKSYGPHLIKQKIYQTLMTKGFSREVIDQAWNLLEFEEVEEDTLLMNQAQKLFRKYGKLSGYEHKTKVIQALMRKGFGYDEVSNVYERLKEEDE